MSLERDKDMELVFHLSKERTDYVYSCNVITCPNEAKGWVDGRYYNREEVSTPNGLLIKSNDMFELTSRVWTETEETGFGVYQYEETTEIVIPLTNENYDVTIVLTDPSEKPYKACIKANQMVKVETVEVKDDIEVTFPIAIIDGLLKIRILPEFIATKKENSLISVVYIKDIIIKKRLSQVSGGKPTIYLASDSTVQTYDNSTAPQTGWGEVFVQYFCKRKNDFKVLSKKVYETSDLIIENRAIGGRSSKSFLLEGRLDDILKDVKPGDYVFVQFGHNDATLARPNRYVHSSEFGNYLKYYIDGVKQRKATCVLVTPVARRNCNEETGEFSISFNSYRNEMIQLSEKLQVPLLDLGKYSTEYLNTIGTEESKKLFLWVEKGEYPESTYKDGVCDNTHLQRKGALIFAEIVTDLIKKYNNDNQLSVIKNILEKLDR